MTEGHTHRIVHLPEHSARLHLLRTPLARSAEIEKVEASRWVWGLENEALAGSGPVRTIPVYQLTPLGIGHGLFGLTICTERAPHAHCRVCGCTDTAACWPPCSWVEPDLCSGCAT